MIIMRLKNKKILFVAEYYPPHVMGGAEISGSIRAELLSKENSITVLTPNYDSLKLVSKKRKGCSMILFPSFRVWFYKSRKTVSQQIKKKNESIFAGLLLIFNLISAWEFKFWIWWANRKYGPFDVLHGNNIESDIGVSFSNIRANKIAHLRDVILFNRFSNSNVLIRHFKKRLKSNINQFIAISKFIKSEYVKLLRISEDRFTVIYNPISNDQVCRLNKAGARKKIGLNNRDKYALFIGSLTKEKGVEFIVCKVAPKFPDVTFLIVGDGYLYDQLDKKKGRNVVLTGKIKNDQAKYYYKAVDVVLVPSRWEEPLGRIPLEAQANGTYSIVTNRGGLPETIPDESKGKVVKLNDFPKELKRYLVKRS